MIYDSISGYGRSKLHTDLMRAYVMCVCPEGICFNYLSLFDNINLKTGQADNKTKLFL